MKRGQNLKYLPAAFTEHGAVMLASVVNSPVAVEASVRVVRAFIRLRELLATRSGMKDKLESLERAVNANSTDIRRIFNVLDEIVSKPEPSRKRIGFQPEGPD